MSERKTDGTLRIGLIQMNSIPCDPLQNREKAERLIRKAAQAGADLVQLPETWNTGFFPKEQLSSLAEPEDGESRKLLSHLAKELHLAIAGGSILTRRGSLICNSFVFYTREGRLAGEYDKVHAFSPSGENAYLQAGGSLCCLDAGGMRAGVLLCYDLRFCEQARLLALQGAELLLVCAQWPRERLEHWRILVQARAIENQVFVSAVNGCGCFDSVQSGGGSLAVSPSGEILAQAGKEEEILLAELRTAERTALKRRMDPLLDRRPSLYAGLCRPAPHQ